MAIYKKISRVSKKIVITILILLIKFYRYISPFIPARCRYHPTCSKYALEALKTHGILKGTFLSMYRIFRCNPFSKRNYFDPVPSKTKGLKK